MVLDHVDAPRKIHFHQILDLDQHCVLPLKQVGLVPELRVCARVSKFVMQTQMAKLLKPIMQCLLGKANLK